MRLILWPLLLLVSSAFASPSVLLFNGTGVDYEWPSLEAVLKSNAIPYVTANSGQLNRMTVQELSQYKLLLIPGGNSIVIANHLTPTALANVHTAVTVNGLNYLGICAGSWVASDSLDLTSGVRFDVYPDWNKSHNPEALWISFPAPQAKLSIYWHDGPQLNGWGLVVGTYPTGSAAIAEAYAGKGFVVLSGVHPDAPASWRTCCKFGTPLQVDLAYTATLIKAAMNATFLPHFLAT